VLSRFALDTRSAGLAGFPGLIPHLSESEIEFAAEFDE
jgi:hypothetical protein